MAKKIASIHVRGEGGMVIEMSLPLPEGVEDRLTRGSLRRVTADGSPYVDEPDAEVPAPPTEQPAKAASKAEWVGWAVTQGADPEDAEAATKADLIELYGAVSPDGSDQ